MKILHITTAHQEDDSRIYEKELKSLAPYYEAALISQRKTSIVFRDIYYFPLGKVTNRLGRIKLQKEVYSYVKKYNPLIIHMHDPELVFLAILLKIQGHTIVWDMHEDLAKQVMVKRWVPKLFRRPLSISINIIERIFLPFFDALITVTPAYTKKYSWHKNVTEIRNFAKVEEFDSIRDNIKPEKSRNVLVYVGGISEERGLLEMLAISRKLSKSHNVELKIAGPKPSEKHLHLIEETNGAEYLGWLSRNEVSELLRISDIGLLTLRPTPNHQFGLAIKMFEYMAAGIPQVTSNFPLLKKIVTETRSGICVNPLDSKEVENAIIYLLENKDEANKMGQNGREAVNREYNWGKESLKLIKLYRKLELELN